MSEFIGEYVGEPVVGVVVGVVLVGAGVWFGGRHLIDRVLRRTPWGS